MKTNLVVLTILSLSFIFNNNLFSQDNPSIDGFVAETKRDSIEVPLDIINKSLAKSNFDQIAPDDASVTPNNTIWMSYDLSGPEENEDEDAGLVGIGLAPRSILKSESFAPNYTLGTSIAGLDFDDNGSLAGSYSIPPDPSGAVGTTHVGHVTNVAMSFHTKAGVEASGYPQSLKSFFSTLSPTTNTFDPKIIWDQYENRWVVVTLEKTASVSKIFLAVSATADPTGTWYYQEINALQTINGEACWFDYPGFAIDDKAIYITGNYFQLSDNTNCSAEIIIVDKGVSSGIYAGTTSANDNLATNPAFNIFNPVTEAGTGFNTTNMPAHTFGTRTASEGTYLIGYGGLSNGTTEFFQVFTITNPLAASPTFAQELVTMGDLDNTSVSFPDAPQLGNATNIETNGRRTLDAIWRNGKLWTVSQVVGTGTNAGQSSVLWGKLNATTAGGLSLDAIGLIEGEDISSGAHTWMPSIAVNAYDHAAVGFSAVNATMYAGVYASIIDGATNTPGSSITIKAGTDDYVRTFGGSSNRWGDYSGTAVDPVNENFWVINEAAITNGTPTSGGEVGRWQVFIQELVAPTGCVANLNITSTPVTAGTYEASTSVTTQSGSTIEVNSGATVVFQGGSSVQLNPGFHAQSGSIFTAQIAGCANPFAGESDEVFSQTRTADLELALADPISLAMTVYPNPSSGATTLEYKLPSATKVFVGLYNQAGQQMDVLLNEQIQSDGHHKLSFSTDNLPDGFYFISIRTDNELKHKKILVNKF